MFSRITDYFTSRHIEVLVLLYLPIALLLLIGIFNQEPFQHFDEDFFQTLGYYLFFGWSFLYIATSTIYIYVGLRFVSFWLRRMFLFTYHRGDSKYLDFPLSFRSTVLSMGFMMLIMFVPLTFNIILTDDILRNDSSHVQFWSEKTMDMDFAVFGSYVPFSLQRSFFENTSATVLIESYVSLGTVLSIIFLLLMLFHKKYFRQFILAFLLIPAISVPFWHAVSVVSPSETFRRNIFFESPPALIYSRTHEVYNPINHKTLGLLEVLESQKSRAEEDIFSATALPSMHVAWGAAAVFYGILLWWPAAFILVPWQILNMIGAVYTLQHYAIDVFAGLIPFLISVLLAHYLIRLEERNFSPRTDRFIALDVLRHDRLLVWHKIKSLYFSVKKSKI